MLSTLALTMASLLASGSPATDGVIEGTVIRAADQNPVPGAEVVLRAKIGDQTLPMASTVADSQGKFRFHGLPVDGPYLYLPGANRDGIYYPGPKLRLSALQPRAELKLSVCDAVAFPNPLVVRQHTIILRPRPGVLEVTESMEIDNPSNTCYVGQAADKDIEPVTLQLAIPANFERITFASEFFGRRFHLLGGKLVTGIPWQPGRRELSFSYVLPAAERHSVWQRPLDLPTADVRVSVHADGRTQAACNLDRLPPQREGEVSFESRNRQLDAGYVLRVDLGDLSVSPLAYAPESAVAVLATLILATVVRCRPLRQS